MNSSNTNERLLKRQRAEKWVNGYTATAVGMVIAIGPIPGAATALLLKVEGTMCYHTGKIYQGDSWSLGDAKAVTGAIGLAAVVGKVAAMEAAILLGPFGLALKPAIAGAIVRILGRVVITYYEDLDESSGSNAGEVACV